MRQFLDKKSNWQSKWERPRNTPVHTLFGTGQHYGIAICDKCGRSFKRNSGIQKFCGPYTSKDSCAYQMYSQAHKEKYLFKKRGIVKIKNIKNDTGNPSKVHTCACGEKYIITREKQYSCIKCIYASNK